MPETYGFLRFQIAGVAFFMYLLFFLIPFVTNATATRVLSDGNRLIAAVGLIFVLSMPIGYIVHQFVVNEFRSERRRRPSHDYIENLVEREQPMILPDSGKARFQILDGLVTFFQSLAARGRRWSSTSEEVTSRQLSRRWSHLYARLALGTYSIVAAIIALILLLALSHLPPQGPWDLLVILLRDRFQVDPLRGLISVVLLLAALGFAGLMNRYQEKLWREICVLELTLLDSKVSDIQSALNEIQDPENFGLLLRSRTLRESSRLHQLKTQFGRSKR